MVSVVVVDDSADVRMLVRLTLERDSRFALVGEAVDGLEALEVVASTQPDLVVLDRQMPRMGGVEALPLIRERSPRSAVVLYTANTDEHTCQAAFAAGAAAVLEKLTTGSALVEELAHALVTHWAAADADCEIRVGPVDAHAAVVWIANSMRILDAVRAHPDIVERQIPIDVLDEFAGFLRTWDEIARADEVFVWAALASLDEVRRVVESWAVIDRIPDERLAAVGCNWAPPEGRPFFAALTAGVLDAMSVHDKTRRLAERLDRQWRPEASAVRARWPD